MHVQGQSVPRHTLAAMEAKRKGQNIRGGRLQLVGRVPGLGPDRSDSGRMVTLAVNTGFRIKQFLAKKQEQNHPIPPMNLKENW